MLLVDFQAPLTGDCFLTRRHFVDAARVNWGLNREEIAGLQPLEFAARDLDSGGELRGKIKL